MCISSLAALSRPFSGHFLLLYSSFLSATPAHFSFLRSLALCPADISSAFDAAAVFIYIMGSLVVCEAGRGITRICVPIWVAFDEAKHSPVLSEAVVFHVFLFFFFFIHVLRKNVLGLCTGLRRVLCSDWAGRHGLRHI